MDKKKLKKLLGEVRRLQNKIGSVKPKEIVTIAKKCGWVSVTRGKEPSYINKSFPDSPIITIPQHSQGIKKFTNKSILQQIEGVLEQKIFDLEENPKPKT